MSEDEVQIDFNDIHLLANLPYKSIYGVPVGHLVNAIEAGAEEIDRLRSELEAVRGALAHSSNLLDWCMRTWVSIEGADARDIRSRVVSNNELMLATQKP